MRLILLIVLNLLILNKKTYAQSLSNSSQVSLNNAITWLQEKCENFEHEEKRIECLEALKSSLNSKHSEFLPIIQFIESEDEEIKNEIKQLLEDYLTVVKTSYNHLNINDFPQWN